MMNIIKHVDTDTIKAICVMSLSEAVGWMSEKKDIGKICAFQEKMMVT